MSYTNHSGTNVPLPWQYVHPAPGVQTVKTLQAGNTSEVRFQAGEAILAASLNQRFEALETQLTQQRQVLEILTQTIQACDCAHCQEIAASYRERLAAAQGLDALAAL